MSRRVVVRYFSDLHREFTKHLPDKVPSIGEDVVVLGGDIDEGLAGIHWARQVFSGRPVVYVFGNHEFYGYGFDTLIEEARTLAAGSNVEILECNAVEIAGLRIIGCSLWTDFQCFGVEHQKAALDHARRYMADYEEIHHRGSGLKPEDTLERCLRSRAWLEQSMTTSNAPTLVVTHHAPSLATLNPRHVGHLSNAAFHNAFDELIRPPCVGWIHGHTHHSVQTQVNGVPLVTNQLGYTDEKLPGFSWDRVLEIEISDATAEDPGNCHGRGLEAQQHTESSDDA